MDKKLAEKVAENLGNETEKAIMAFADAIPEGSSVLAVVIALRAIEKCFYQEYPELHKYDTLIEGCATELARRVD